MSATRVSRAAAMQGFASNARQRTVRRRRGTTIVELLATTAVLGAALVSIAPLMGLVAQQRRATEQRQAALVEAANVLERLASQPFADVTPSADVALSEHAQRILEEGQISVAVAESDEMPRSKRIAVELRWKSRTGRKAAPVRLTTWIYQQAESE